MRMNVAIRGLDTAVAKLDRVANAHRTRVLADGLAEGGAEAIEEARRTVPVDTGRLRDSLHVGGYTRLTPSYRKIGRYGALRGPEGKGKEVKVFLGSTLPHAHLVERGTRRMRARPFMRKALDSKEGDIVAAVDRSIEREIEG